MEETRSGPRFPYVLFDLGSTLIRFEGDWATVMAQMMRQATQYLRAVGYDLDPGSFPETYFGMVRAYYEKRDDAFIEYPSERVLQEALSAHDVPLLPPEQLRHAIRVMYAVSQAHWHLEADAIPTLKALRERGSRLGIVSNAADDGDVQTLVDNAGLRSFFDFILTSVKIGVRKPNPRIFKAALAVWGARPEQAVMVGDTVSADIAGANGLGIASVWIRRRADTPENRAAASEHPPGATIDALSELPGLLEHWHP